MRPPPLLSRAALMAAILPALAWGTDINDARLRDAGRSIEWFSCGRDDGNQGFLPLTGMDAGNAAALAPARVCGSGVVRSFQAPPIVVDGELRLSLPVNHVVAVDAGGKVLFGYRLGDALLCSACPDPDPSRPWGGDGACPAIQP
ncbi:MAG: hypothetical protein WCJ69_06905 [Betaproteobacteria bacterium]|jgi:glucose dehydrogenase